MTTLLEQTRIHYCNRLDRLLSLQQVDLAPPFDKLVSRSIYSTYTALLDLGADKEELDKIIFGDGEEDRHELPR